MVNEILQVVQNKYGDVTKEEIGKIVRRAFPQSKRKRHHSGTNYFYKGVKKKAEDQQSEPELTALQLQTRLDEEKGNSSRIQSTLDEVKSRYEEKESYCTELESKIDSERKKAHELKESAEKMRAEVDSIKKHESLTAQKLEATKEKLHATQSEFAKFKEQCLAKDTPSQLSAKSTLQLTVIARDQLIGYKNASKLGTGSFGDCFLMQYRNIEVCVKYCRESSYQSVVMEAKFIRKLEGHPNLPLLFGVSPKNESPPYIVTKFHGASSSRKNTLQDVLYSKKADYPMKCFLKLALQCGRALMHIHNRRILHNDLKCNNVLVDIIEDEPCAVIIDFGKSCLVQKARVKYIPLNERDEYRKSYPHIAPELVNMSRSQSFASDVYSYGFLLREVSVKANGLAGAAEMCLVEGPEKRAAIDNVIEVIQNALK